MAELITLTKDGPLGQAGMQVWVDSTEAEPASQEPQLAPEKSAAESAESAK